MLPKAVLSFVGRLVGIAAVLASPLAAKAAEPSDVPTTQPSVHRSPSQGHGHKKAEKKARKHGHHADAHAEASLAPKEKPAKAAPSEGDTEVTTERASSRTPPKQSSTPLPSLAAATTKPLVQPISCKAEPAVEIKAHAIEPRHTPIIRVSTHEAGQAGSRAALAEKKTRHVKAPCLHAPVDVTRGGEEEIFALTQCDGSVAPLAVEEMSILVRPGSAAKPAAPIADVAAKAAKEKSGDLAPGIKKLDERLVERMQQVLDHFAKPSVTPKVFVVSGYRPTSKGSFHAMGRAIDFRVEGVENTDLVAFCKTLPDTGCGYYPNSSFIHLDVRETGAGHVAWIDTSGPGEKPEYVASWPPPPKGDDEDPVKLLAKLDELQLLPASPATQVTTEEADEEDATPEKAKPEPAAAACATKKSEER